jgi:glutamate racemase
MTIGVFDSGVGGLTVVKELKRLLPETPIFYYGDTARVPYGAKSRETIIRYSLEIGEILTDMGIEGLVIACNTASAFATEALKERFPIPVLGVIAPGAKKACQTTINGRIGVIGTRGTIASRAYESEIGKIDPKIKTFSRSCPLFVPLVEEGIENPLVTELIAKEYLAPLLMQSIDTLVLGCTHYPLLTDLIQGVVGPGVTVVNSGAAVAEEVQKMFPEGKEGEDCFMVSDDPERFHKVAEQFLGRRVLALTT